MTEITFLGPASRTRIHSRFMREIRRLLKFPGDCVLTCKVCQERELHLRSMCVGEVEGDVNQVHLMAILYDPFSCSLGFVFAVCLPSATLLQSSVGSPELDCRRLLSDTCCAPCGVSGCFFL
jgi:hypothetical protein